MILVADSSALITLARIGRLQLLRAMASVVYVPSAVFDEVVLFGAGRPGSEELANASWVVRRPVRDTESVDLFRGRLGHGESEAIVLAKELGADFLVVDDATARRVAEEEGQRVVGLPGLLINAKERGLVSAIKPLLDAMLASGFFLDTTNYRSILQRAGE